MPTKERAKKTKILILDVDGILTDGRIIYDDKGTDIKLFDVYDGLGIHLLGKVGIKTILISARASKTIKRRAKDIGVTDVFQNARNKLNIYNKILKKFKLRDKDVCFMGDDLVDLGVLKRAGFAASVPNARPEVKKVAHYITRKNGGRGAVREVCELILKSQNKWKSAIKDYV